jgi:hypothetical protein
MWYFRTTIRTRIDNSKKLTVPVHVLKLQTMTRKNAEGVLLLLFFRGTGMGLDDYLEIARDWLG